MSDRLLLKPAQAAELLSVSKRTLYNLMRTNPDIRAAVVEVPGLRGRFLRLDLIRRAVERLSVPDLQESSALASPADGVR